MGRTTDAMESRAARAIRLRCPACEHGLPNLDATNITLSCSRCGFSISESNGIRRALTPESKAHFERFVRNYEAVRAKVGGGSQHGGLLPWLPVKDLTKKTTGYGESRSTLLSCRNISCPEMERANSSGCSILDIGAGNGWLSYRLAKRGHQPVAVDLWDNDIDGLGAARHYLAQLPRAFPRFQADMDHLPFDSGQFDIAIFNASFHYSANYEASLREVIRCLRRPGLVIVADSPFYYREESGKQMLEERRTFFEEQFGVRSDSIHTQEYLTPKILNRINRAADDSVESFEAMVRRGLGASPCESPPVTSPRSFEVLLTVVQARAIIARLSET